MKVTALIPDELVADVKELSRGKNLTESLIIVMTEWVSLKRIQTLNQEIQKRPLKFKKNFKAQSVRKLNRESQ